MPRTTTTTTIALMCGAVAMMMACGGPPKEALDAAAKALADAEGRSSCAQEKYDAAEALLEEARALARKEKHDEAERKARAAAKLAREAKAEADANWERCNRRQEVVAEAKKPSEADGQGGATGPATLQTVYFGYDSSELSDTTRSTLEENARWFREHEADRVVLEGHTDERGSVEYNLALGESRARKARDFLMKLGVEGKRMSVLSYGEEKPAAYETSEDAYTRNRRVEFKPRSGK